MDLKSNMSWTTYINLSDYFPVFSKFNLSNGTKTEKKYLN